VVNVVHSLGFDLLHQYDPALAGIVVPVELKVADREVRILDSRLDTGATHCIFKREYGELLGLRVDSGIEKVFGTAEGTFTGFGHEVSMCAFGFEFSATVYFANFRYPRNVLGRYGWLQQMRIGIVDYEGKLFVARYGDES
jgi:hypothetical protein